ncbi:MAG: uracil-DNA glycosylase [Betaproteobacteria bacterium]|nr:MAG: uracil-DNA glycosylase [Betaproteobacteria bacterium]
MLRKAPRGAVFNPWWQVDADNDLGRLAPRIRREQLRAYFSERIGKARLALVGEALSYRGGHFTGIAMTSERILLGGMTGAGIEPRHVFSGLPPRRTSKPQKNPRGFAEPTASMIWSALVELGVPGDRFVLWNAFPWHSFNPRSGMLSNRTPTKAELAAGTPVSRWVGWRSRRSTACLPRSNVCGIRQVAAPCFSASRSGQSFAGCEGVNRDAAESQQQT